MKKKFLQVQFVRGKAERLCGSLSAKRTETIDHLWMELDALIDSAEASSIWLLNETHPC